MLVRRDGSDGALLRRAGLFPVLSADVHRCRLVRLAGGHRRLVPHPAQESRRRALHMDRASRDHTRLHVEPNLSRIHSGARLLRVDGGRSGPKTTEPVACLGVARLFRRHDRVQAGRGELSVEQPDHRCGTRRVETVETADMAHAAGHRGDSYADVGWLRGLSRQTPRWRVTHGNIVAHLYRLCLACFVPVLGTGGDRARATIALHDHYGRRRADCADDRCRE